MLLKIFSDKHEFVGIVEEYNSLSYKECFAAVGTLSLTAPATKRLASLLRYNHLIYIDNRRTYVIKFINITTDETGAEIMTVMGQHILCEFDRACVETAVTYTGDAAGAILTAAHGADSVLDIEYKSVTAGDVGTYQLQAGSVLENILRLCAISGLGACAGFNPLTGKVTFTVAPRVDKSDTQTLHAPVIISRQFDNVLDDNYTIDVSTYKNKCIVAGDMTVTVDKTGGGDEYCMYKKSSLKRSDYDNDTAYIAALTEEGEAELAKRLLCEAYDVTISHDGDLCDVGDIVTVSNVKYGLYLRALISEIETIIEPTGKTVNYTIGAYVPTAKQIYKE